MTDPAPATGADQGGALTEAEREALRASFVHDEYEAEFFAVVERIVAARLADEREAALLDAAAELDAQPPKLKAQYVGALRLYAAEPGRMQVRAARIVREEGQR